MGARTLRPSVSAITNLLEDELDGTVRILKRFNKRTTNLRTASGRFRKNYGGIMGRPREDKIPKLEKQKKLETLIENALQNTYDLDVRMYLTEAKKTAKELRNEY